MKLSVMQENLARGLSVVSRAVSSRSTLPVLANVLLKTEDARAQADRHQPRDRDHLLGARQDRDGRRDDRPGQAPDRPRQLAAGRRPGRPRAPGAATRSTSAAAGSRRTSRGSTPTSSRRSRPPASGRPPGSPRTSCAQALERDGLRRRQRRGPADPDRRPGPVRGRPADPGRRRQLPDRGQDDPDPRRRSPETSVVIPARALNELARVLADVDDPVDDRPGRRPQPGPLPPRRASTWSAG